MSKIKIRQGVFETNSSSMHSIAIVKKKSTPLKFPKELLFRPGDFGWEHEWIDDVDGKASYLWTACQYCKNPENLKRKIRTYLEVGHGIKCTFYDNTKGYVDHGNEAIYFAETVCNDRYLLDNYLFSTLSVVETSNDNDGPELTEFDKRKMKVFYKGN